MLSITTYHHRFQVEAPLAQVAEFHRRSASMAAITPPPVIVRIHQAPEVLKEGDLMDFSMWLGPLPMRWQARIEAVSENGFTDRQMRGPFAEWVHRHGFIALDDHATEIVDVINLRLKPNPIWWIIGMGMRLSLPILFTYRAWKTRRLLK
jgi:ligand-binding SRPBCC domain-containing protein